MVAVPLESRVASKHLNNDDDEDDNGATSAPPPPTSSFTSADVAYNASSTTPPLPPKSNEGSVVAGILMVFIVITAAAACLWFIKRKKARRRRLYMAAARKASLANEASDLDAPPSTAPDDDDVIIENVNDVFASPPLHLRESSSAFSLTDRLFNSVGRLFGSKVPLGAAKVRTSASGDDAAAGRSGGSGSGSGQDSSAPIILNGRIHALYEEIMKQETGRPGGSGARGYGVLQEELTPEGSRRRTSARRSASFRPASELSAVSEVSLELMDREISTGLMDRTMTGSTTVGFQQSHLDDILKRGISDVGGGGVGGSGVGGSGVGGGVGGDIGDVGVVGIVGIGDFCVGDGELADELESSLPTEAVVDGAGVEVSSTGFIADKQNPNKYYSIAYTEYYLDD